jgi:hypothetical protein
MKFKEIKQPRKSPELKITERYILLPVLYRTNFESKPFIKLFIDKKQAMIGLMPSSDPSDYELKSHNTHIKNALWCQKFLHEYGIPEQMIPLTWDKTRRLFVGHIKIGIKQ